MAESFKTKLLRWQLNCIPCFLFTGARITYIANDLKEVRIELPLSWMTRNYIGTIFGGSMFASTDPIYMVMLIKCLGSNYSVVDKAGSIRFLKLAKETLFATCILNDAELEEIKTQLEIQPKLDRNYSIDLRTKAGETCASIERTINIRRKMTASARN
jgi:acyl-coenzyme A thioesterase PaaI-like protein